MLLFRLLFISIFIADTITLNAQKKGIDTNVLATWPSLTVAKICNSGNYIGYSVLAAGEYKIIVKSTNSDWQREFIHCVPHFTFSNDNKLFIFSKSRDTIGLLDLDKDSINYINQILSQEIFAQGNRSLIAYFIKSFPKELIIRDFSDGTVFKYSNVNRYTVSPNGNVLILQKETAEKDMFDVVYVDLISHQEISIGKYNNINDIFFDKKDKQMAFRTTSVINDSVVPVIRYYVYGSKNAEIIVSPFSAGMQGMSMSPGRHTFSKDGDKFFFYTRKNNLSSDRVNSLYNNADVNIWNYKDDSIKGLQRPALTLAVVNLSRKDTVLRLTQNHDDYFFDLNERNNGNLLLITSNSFGNQSEYKWRQSAIPDLYLVSSADGSRKLIKHHYLSGAKEFSPGCKYVVWYDKEKKNWYTYNIKRMTNTNITKDIKFPLYNDDDHPDFAGPAGIAGWLENENSVLIYDRYDIWKVNLDRNIPPSCLTNGYGRRNNIKLRYFNFNPTTDRSSHLYVIKSIDTLLLSAFNIKTKEGGFFKLIVGSHPVLSKLTMAPKSYYPWRRPEIQGWQKPLVPIKAKDANKYLVSQSSTKEFMNLYVTEDFIKFTQLTNITPQLNYNWYTSELINWKLSNGTASQGVLYKPEDFDKNKKYPVIFYYYEQLSDVLNEFIDPVLSSGQLNISWFASNGYLVFVPDVHYEIGYPGRSAYNTMISAAAFLSKYPWVNKKKMGLQGHSYGGFQTNYIISHTSLFAAAASSSGLSNVISSYGDMSLNGIERHQWFYEERQGRIGASLWKSPELYIENSAVFRTDKVKTPLLLMHNVKDGAVPFTQAAEWYSDLVRARKKVWMLSYNGEGHTIDEQRNQLDYTLRLQQFFDHYLKDKPAPIWMTHGINAESEKADSGLQFDTTGTKP
jgi:dienelactone hydrolase